MLRPSLIKSILRFLEVVIRFETRVRGCLLSPSSVQLPLRGRFLHPAISYKLSVHPITSMHCVQVSSPWYRTLHVKPRIRLPFRLQLGLRQWPIHLPDRYQLLDFHDLTSDFGRDWIEDSGHSMAQTKGFQHALCSFCQADARSYESDAEIRHCAMTIPLIAEPVNSVINNIPLSCSNNFSLSVEEMESSCFPKNIHRSRYLPKKSRPKHQAPTSQLDIKELRMA